VFLDGSTCTALAWCVVVRGLSTPWAQGVPTAPTAPRRSPLSTTLENWITVTPLDAHLAETEAYLAGLVLASHGRFLLDAAIATASSRNSAGYFDGRPRDRFLLWT